MIGELLLEILLELMELDFLLHQKELLQDGK
jgi:hypothetical protein